MPVTRCESRDNILQSELRSAVSAKTSREPVMTAPFEKTHAVREQFVRPVYLELLHANFTRRTGVQLRLTGREDNEIANIRARIATNAKMVSDGQIEELLAEREWRGRLSAGWYVGLSKRIAFADRIAALLLDSELTYAGQGFCVALGLIGSDNCRRYLRAYLSKYLPLQGRFYDQQWAIGALAYIERTQPEEYLLPELWAEGHNWNPLDAIQRFSDMVGY